MSQGILLITCGPSGVGKTSLGRELRAAYPRLVLSVSYTTRPMRDGEVNGVDYHFTDRQTFERMRNAGEFAEWAEVHGNYYATPKSEIYGAFERGEDVFFDIDYQGAEQLIAAFPEESVSLLVVPPSMPELERRLRGRKTDSDEVIARRLKAAAHELAQFELFDFIVANDEFDRALEDMVAIYRASRMRTSLHLDEMREMLG